MTIGAAESLPTIPRLKQDKVPAVQLPLQPLPDSLIHLQFFDLDPRLLQLQLGHVAPKHHATSLLTFSSIVALPHCLSPPSSLGSWSSFCIISDIQEDVPAFSKMVNFPEESHPSITAPPMLHWMLS